MSKLFQFILFIILVSCSYENDVTIEGYFSNEGHFSEIIILNDTSQSLIIENSSTLDSLKTSLSDTISFYLSDFGSSIVKVKGDIYSNTFDLNFGARNFPVKRLTINEVISYKILTLNDQTIDTIEIFSN